MAKQCESWHCAVRGEAPKCFCNVLGPSVVGKCPWLSRGQPLVLHLICWQQSSKETQNSVLCAWHCWDGRELWCLQTGLKLLQPLYFIDSWQSIRTDYGRPFSSTFLILFVLVRLHKVAVYNYWARMCTLKRSEGFSMAFTSFLVLFEHRILMWVNIKWLWFTATGPPGCPLCRLLRRCLFVGSLHRSPAATLDHGTASGSRLVTRFVFGPAGWSQAQASVEVEVVLFSESDWYDFVQSSC